jgi:hypothetical protein
VFVVSRGVVPLLSVLFAVGISALGKERGDRVLACQFCACGVMTLFGICIILA